MTKATQLSLGMRAWVAGFSAFTFGNKQGYPKEQTDQGLMKNLY